MDTEICHEMMFANRKPRETGGIIQSKAKGGSTWSKSQSPRPKNQELSFQYPRTGEMDVPDQREREFALPPLFCSILALSGLDNGCPHW